MAQLSKATGLNRAPRSCPDDTDVTFLPTSQTVADVDPCSKMNSAVGCSGASTWTEGACVEDGPSSMGAPLLPPAAMSLFASCA